MSSFIGAMATRYIRSTLEEAREKLKSAGLEKWQYDNYNGEFALDDPNIFKGSAVVEKILFTGATSFVINDLSFDASTSKVIFDLSIPKLFLAIGNSGLDLTIFHNNTQAVLKGWVTAFQFCISGEVQMNLAEDGGVQTEIIELNTNVEQIQSNITLKIFGFDMSVFANNFFTNLLPGFLNIIVNLFKTPLENLLKVTMDRQFLETF